MAKWQISARRPHGEAAHAQSIAPRADSAASNVSSQRPGPKRARTSTLLKNPYCRDELEDFLIKLMAEEGTEEVQEIALGFAEQLAIGMGLPTKCGCGNWSCGERPLHDCSQTHTMMFGMEWPQDHIVVPVCREICSNCGRPLVGWQGQSNCLEKHKADSGEDPVSQNIQRALLLMRARTALHLRPEVTDMLRRDVGDSLFLDGYCPYMQAAETPCLQPGLQPTEGSVKNSWITVSAL